MAYQRGAGLERGRGKVFRFRGDHSNGVRKKCDRWGKESELGEHRVRFEEAVVGRERGVSFPWGRGFFYP